MFEHSRPFPCHINIFYQPLTAFFPVPTPNLTYRVLLMPPSLPGSAIISGLAFLCNPRVQTGILTDSYFFDVIIRTYADGTDNPYVMCSLHYESVTDCNYMSSNVYMISAKVCSHLYKPQYHSYLVTRSLHLLQTCTHPVRKLTNTSFALIGVFKIISMPFFPFTIVRYVT